MENLIRERFQRERPGLHDLILSGDASEAVSQGEYLDLLTMLIELKHHRERQGLSLTDVAQRQRHGSGRHQPLGKRHLRQSNGRYALPICTCDRSGNRV